MSVHEPGGGRLDQEISRVREAESERSAQRYATEHPDPPADNPRTRGVLARVRTLLGRRRVERQRS